MIYHYGVEENRFRYKPKAYKEIASRWLDSHRIEYFNDL
jgi:hypothetical protein